MQSSADIRPGEIAVDHEPTHDASVTFIGRIRTPYRERAVCPRQGKPDGPLCQIEVDSIWRPALSGLQPGQTIQVLYWMHLARRDLLVQNPRMDGDLNGTFSLRSPVRPNPIASSIVEIHAIADGVLSVRGLDCVDGTPLLDIKPVHCPKA
ncbi:tRNA (N6-threonylcarbamoyladenosine(37)-N6)-methyltransferase TrmO [Flaviflagellibacter deserti]|uniref:tRNA (N6-threonylcarbamoyladenosine(37)-N6)-methyltransferase TrmO n=1 Tax=Flaviflagellibacter deserti TaxID=2267266 RepID=A0ABV9Z1I4_9HYPH